ncbi:hypothetical protein LINPERPRIM_LOCUS36624 [Linum perenne]
MAGSSELPLPNPNNGTNNNTGGQWLIHYARFFNFPALQPTCPSLVSLRSRSRNNTSSGTWLSSSSMVSLQLLRQPIDADGFRLVLLVSSQGKIYEEHCISKLHFSWPQVQKFAMRFMTSAHAQDFMSSLKISLQVMDAKLVCIIQLQFHQTTTNLEEKHSCSTSQEMSNLYPIGNYQPQVQLLQPNYRFAQYVETHPTHDSESRTATAPPSFNTLIPDMNSDIHQGTVGL